VSGLLLFGTMVTIFSKSAYQIYGVGLEDATHAAKHTFQKPWAMVLVMFFGMTWCLLIHQMHVWRLSQRQVALSEPLLGSTAPAAHNTNVTKSLLVIVPAVADLVATALMNMGLVHITASVYQMLRGAELVFAAIFSIAFLKRKLNYMHLNGLLLSVLGVACVGGSSLLSGAGAKDGESQEDVMYGMGLVVLSQMVQAVQLTFEDYFLADLRMAPLQVVGFEGLYGMLLMVFAVCPAIFFLPGSDVGGKLENSLDSIELIKSSKPILILCVCQACAMLMYNFAGMCVTDHLGAVFRTILETLRTMFVWIVDCCLFYFTSTGLGEGLNEYSLLQLTGFVILVVGTLVYDKGDVIAATRMVGEAEAAADTEASTTPTGENTDAFAIPPRAGPTMAMACSPSMAKPSMTISAHSLSSSYVRPAAHGTPI
jgi:drug/metabolite transporter (DMT)-like permease